MDVHAVNSLPEDLKSTFCKLLTHAYSIDTRAKKLILDLIKLVVHCFDEEGSGTPPAETTSADNTPNLHPEDTKDNSAELNVSTDGAIDGDNLGCSSQYELQRSRLYSTPNVKCHSQKVPSLKSVLSNYVDDDSNRSVSLPVPNLPRSSLKPLNSTPGPSSVDRVMKKLIKPNDSTPAKIVKSSSRFVPPPSGYPADHPLYRCLYKKFDDSVSKVHGNHQSSQKSPLSDCTNSPLDNRVNKSVSFAAQDVGPSDVIMLDPDPNYVPDSVSPSPRPKLSRLSSLKSNCGQENVSPRSSQKFPIVMQTLEFTAHTTPRIRSNNLKALFSHLSNSKSTTEVVPSSSKKKECLDVEIVGQSSLAANVQAMSKLSEEVYNSNLRSSTKTPGSVQRVGVSGSQPSSRFKPSDSSTGGKLPLHGPRRFAVASKVYCRDYVTATNKFSVSKSEVLNYKILCKLASSQFQSEDAVNLSGVRCTFWSLGESLKPDGLVKTFVVSAFCYSLFQKPNGHPDVSKRHYIFANIGENLLKDFDDADQNVLARAFKRSSKARPLNHSNALFFPTCFEDHWFVFVVDIKDRKFVILDSYYKENDEFQEIVRERMISSFEHHWEKYVQVEMGFQDFDTIYPAVPEQPLDNTTDSGIYAMMFIENWISPRSMLTSVFSSTDIPNIRIKIANDLVFQPKNSGMKQRVIEFKQQDL
ncbi:hypothetical protein PVAP13_9KG279800 [Panicum virgatum]|uniref:Ubiquitin-like protease family profile domain-containing protein n=1 Tax=Panicum virgatum TaxID=38727 RepID=A0A8T0NKH7_PANVG|nr:hypothetical protein PVAP13_9KG279800 [Panicum virgatum]